MHNEGLNRTRNHAGRRGGAVRKLTVRREYAQDILKIAEVDVSLTEKIRKCAAELEGFGFRGVDALHLASAEAGHADFFCTCDDGIIKKAKSEKVGRIKVLLPTDLIKELKL